jgi:hypothetical protein
MGGWTDEDGLENVPDSLWRTFVADRGPDGKTAPVGIDALASNA